jgi:hypothetical protein
MKLERMGRRKMRGWREGKWSGWVEEKWEDE